MKNHLTYTQSAFSTVAQETLSQNDITLTSEILNIIKYYGTSYAEEIFQRNKDALAKYFDY
jgi:hypothetical protein